MTLQPEDLTRFLPLYLGCDIRFSRPSGASIEKLTAADLNDIETGFISLSLIKPILRPLSSMTKEEAKEFLGDAGIKAFIYEIAEGGIKYLEDEDAGAEYLFFSAIDPQRFHWLLSKHFDLFNLIPSGLAIDKTTMK